MSRSSNKIKINNNLRPNYGRRVNERSNRVFECAENNPVSETVILYRLVFLSRKAGLLSILLCLCFLSQPFQNVYANEQSTEGSPVLTEVKPLPPEVTKIELPAVEVVEPENIVLIDENSQNTNTENAAPAATVVASSSEVSTSEAQTDSNIVTSASSTTDVTKVTNLISSTTKSTTTSSEITSENNVTNNQNTNLDNTADSETDTQSSEIDTVNTDLISIVKSDSQFEFSKDECTRIQDGSFYCQKRDSSSTAQDSLIAAPDVDGDLEIYLVRGGVRTQVTNNLVDDASPYYDEYSKTIVWHRLVDDRYQIISYDTKTGQEKQLTNDTVNNMQPTRHGEYTVWQRWVTNNWEVILFDGIQERQVTDSPRHDIAPHVRGPLVIWNSRSNDGTQSLMTYDIKDRTYTTIADGEGVSVSNPRMVVMYEATYENGDIIMKGFDLVSGEIVPLHSSPRQLPDKLPNTDSTGETRALIQSKPSLKQVEVVNNITPTGSTTPPIVPLLNDESTLDLRSTTTPELIVEEIFVESATSSIPDLILPVVPKAENTDSATTSSQTTSEL